MTLTEDEVATTHLIPVEPSPVFGLGSSSEAQVKDGAHRLLVRTIDY